MHPTPHLSITDDELELLLLHQPALFHRMRYKWAALAAVAKWLVKRLRTKTKDQPMGLEIDTIVILRNIKMPSHLAEGWRLDRHLDRGSTGAVSHSAARGEPVGDSPLYSLRMKQKGNAVVIEAVQVRWTRGSG